MGSTRARQRQLGIASVTATRIAWSSSSDIAARQRAQAGRPGHHRACTDAARTGQGHTAMHPIASATGATITCSVAIQDDVMALARAGSSDKGGSSAAGLGRSQQQARRGRSVASAVRSGGSTSHSGPAYDGTRLGGHGEDSDTVAAAGQPAEKRRRQHSRRGKASNKAGTQQGSEEARRAHKRPRVLCTWVACVCLPFPCFFSYQNIYIIR
jgi:hypothetical protein